MRAGLVFMALLAGCGAPEATCDRWLTGGRCATIEDAGAVLDAAVPIDAATLPDLTTAPDLAEPPWTELASGTMADLRDVWGSGAGDVWAVGNGAVLRSKDHGQTWVPVDVGGGSSYGSIWGDGAGTILISEGYQTFTEYRSENGGATWAAVATNQPAVGRIRCHGSECLAVGPAVLHSTDAGKSWSDVTPKQSNYYAAWLDSTTAWVGSDGVIGSTIFRSNDHGATWIGAEPLSMHFIYDLWGTGDVLVAVSTITILRSHDHGESWFPQVVPPWNVLNAELWCVWGSSADDVYAGGEQAILHSSDGQTWRVVWTKQVSFIEGIWGSGADDVYAVGDKGLILHRVGP